MSVKGELVNNLTQGSVTKKLLLFSLPFILSNVLQAAFNIVDMVVVGRFIGSEALSAVSIGGQITNLLTTLCMGFCGGGQVLIAQHVGLDDREGVKRSIGTLLTVVIGISVLLTALGITLSRTALAAMNTPAESMDYAYSYLIVCCCGLIFIYGFNAVCAVLYGMGNSKFPLLIMAIAAVTNLILDVVFIAGFGMGTEGAALATVIGQAIACVFSVQYLYRHRDSFVFDFKLSSFRIDKDKIKPLLKLGLPYALETNAITISLMFVNSFVNSYGLIATAVAGIGTRLTHVVAITSNSMMTSGSNMIGQNIGAGKQDRVKKIVHISLLINMAACVIWCALALCLPTEIFSIFDKNPEVLAMAPGYMRIACVTYLSFAMMSPYLSLLNGIGYAAFSLFIGILDGVVARVGLSLLLCYTAGMGLNGLWLGNALAGFVTVFIAGAYFYSGEWKHRKLLANISDDAAFPEPETEIAVES